MRSKIFLLYIVNLSILTISNAFNNFEPEKSTFCQDKAAFHHFYERVQKKMRKRFIIKHNVNKTWLHQWTFSKSKQCHRIQLYSHIAKITHNMASDPLAHTIITDLLIVFIHQDKRVAHQFLICILFMQIYMIGPV